VPAGGELDHNQPWPDGLTAASNLTGFLHRPPPRQASGSRLVLRPGPRRPAHPHHTQRADRRHRPSAVLRPGGVSWRESSLSRRRTPAGSERPGPSALPGP
jgi:hypothetical protein